MSFSRGSYDCALLLGDSITQNSISEHGLTTFLAQHFVRKLDVVNRGFGGYNTELILPMAKDMISSEGDASKPTIRLMTLWLGANDACLPTAASKQHVPLADYKLNLLAILRLLPPSTPALLITPPMLQPERWQSFQHMEQVDRTVEHTLKYVEACREVVMELKEEGRKAELVDIWKAMEEYISSPGNDAQDLFTDGLHLTEEGYRLVNTLVKPRLISFGLEPLEMAQPYAPWDEALAAAGK